MVYVVWSEIFVLKSPLFLPINTHSYTMQEAGSSCSIILVHAGPCSSNQGPLRFMQALMNRVPNKGGDPNSVHSATH